MPDNPTLLPSKCGACGGAGEAGKNRGQERNERDEQRTGTKDCHHPITNSQAASTPIKLAM
ncbi:hypothetical protein E2C01_076624 [Portunus trituberculatus]|uniref:Uncharacterized protein n=1 Tax=Portunus trituberculatus TaxID=210409 RepID=A0A5B7IDP0_PORTR|nr:hypothetical protein [Portunus trituberculatus]